MSIEVGFWKIKDSGVQRVEYASIDSERRLETLIESDISILNDDLLVIGRQVRTAYGKVIDLLAMDAEGKITIIELKRNLTPREVVTQTLDYASWVLGLEYQEIKDIYLQYTGKELEEGFSEKFGASLPERINQEHDMLIVCSALDPECERIITYLSSRYDVPINVVFFRYFRDGDSEYLSRSWMIDPATVEERAIKTSVQVSGEAWNGRDFIVNVDVIDGDSTWEDAVRYGFVSAGGGRWYSRSLSQLFVGARVFAMIPKKSYLGVGTVVETSVPMPEFKVEVDGQQIPITQADLACEAFKEKDLVDPDKMEYFVRVKWIKTVPEDQAYWEKGLRANQNSAFKLKSTYTLNKLLAFFGLEE